MNQRAFGLLAPFAVVSLASLVSGCAASPPDEGDVGTAESAISISANEKTAYEFFVARGLKGYQAAGIVGNLMQESNVSPTVAQYGGGPGRGIAQWSVGGRWNADHDDNVAWYAGQHGQSEWSLNLQLEFVWYELTTFSGYGLGTLRGSQNVSQATIAFQNDFEGCGTCDESQRITYAERVLSAMGGSSGGGGGGGGAKGCWSNTKGREMVANACVQSKFDDRWYQCDDGAWVNRWTDPAACDGVYPL